MKSTSPEVWLRGSLPGLALPLQPVAQCLLQAREELNELMNGFPDSLLWRRPSAMASVGFHLQHLTGVLDRLFTYARGVQLNQQQMDWLSMEGQPLVISASELLEKFNRQVELAITQLKSTPEAELYAERGVGRKKIPSTVAGLLFHAAEHTMRHLGQLLVTVNIVKTMPAV